MTTKPDETLMQIGGTLDLATSERVMAALERAQAEALADGSPRPQLWDVLRGLIKLGLDREEKRLDTRPVTSLSVYELGDALGLHALAEVRAARLRNAQEADKITADVRRFGEAVKAAAIQQPAMIDTAKEATELGEAIAGAITRNGGRMRACVVVAFQDRDAVVPGVTSKGGSA